LLIKYIKSVLWRVAKRVSYIEEARCLKVNVGDRTAMTSEAITFYRALQLLKFNRYIGVNKRMWLRWNMRVARMNGM